MNVQAPDSIQIMGTSPLDPSNLSALTTATFGTGNAGALTVSTGTLTLRGGAQITSPTIGAGDAGQVTVNATNLIDIQGTSPLSNSAIVSNSFGSGNASTTIVNTPRLKLKDGGAVFSSGLSSGDAGSIIINAQDSIEMSNSSISEKLFDNAQISSNIQSASPLLQFILGLPPIATGASGSVIINTRQLTMTNGATISGENSGPNQGGTIEINANVVNLNNSAKISTVTASGKGGDVVLNLQDVLLLRHNSLILTQSAGTGNGGNITIDSPIIVGLENSDIIANAKGGAGGDISITIQDLIGLKFRNTLTPRTDITNDITASSEFSINGNVSVNTIGINPTNALNTLPVDVVDSSRQIADRCAAAKTGSFVSTGRGGIPKSPIQTRKAGRTWNDLRDTGSDRSASTTVTTSIAQTANPIVEASAIEVDATGAIALIAPKSIEFQSAATCGIAGSIGEP